MTNYKSAWMCLYVLVALACGPAALGQAGDADGQQPADATEMIVYRPKHITTDGVQGLLRQLDVAAASVNDTTVIIRGTSSTLREIEQLLQAIDVADVAAKAPTDDAIVPFGSYPVQELRELLDVLPRERNTRMAIDTINRVVIVRGDAKDVAAVQRLIDLHGKDQQPLEMQFFFLRGHIGGADAPADLPKDLSVVVPTLTRNGFGGVSLLAPMVVRMNDGVEFEQSAQLQTGAFVVDATSTISFRLKGVARSIPGRDTIQLMLESRVDVHTRKGQVFSTGPSRAFELETTVSARLGAFVVLAAAPAATADGEAIALVVRVSRADQD